MNSYGNQTAQRVLAKYLANAGRVDDLHSLVAAGDRRYAPWEIVEIFAKDGPPANVLSILIDTLRYRFPQAPDFLVRYLRQQENVEVLIEFASQDLPGALDALVDIYADHQAIDALTGLWRQGSTTALRCLSDLLALSGRSDEALSLLIDDVEDGGFLSVWKYGNLLSWLGRTDDAARFLRATSENSQSISSVFATKGLSDFYYQMGDPERAITTLRRAARPDDPLLGGWLAILLLHLDIEEELHHMAERGERFFAQALCELYLRQGREDGLRRELTAGNPSAAIRLAYLWKQNGRADQAYRLMRYGLAPDGGVADGDATGPLKIEVVRNDYSTLFGDRPQDPPAPFRPDSLRLLLPDPN